jgi:hypothetical protein
VKHNISTAELDMLLFLYSEGVFSSKDFERYNTLFTWRPERMHRMIKKDFIRVFRKGGGNLRTLYELTYKSKRIVDNIYKQLEGEMLLSTNPSISPMFKKDAPYSHKVMQNAILQMRKAVTDIKKGNVTLDQN